MKAKLHASLKQRSAQAHCQRHDGTIGEVNLYFDDEPWTIRFLVVNVGSWLYSRKVLISPLAAGKPDWTFKLLPPMHK